MQDWQQRVIAEKNELDAKRDKLRAALESDDFQAKVRLRDYYLLSAQYDVMTQYSHILAERINLF